MFKSGDLTSQLLPTIVTSRGVLAMLVTSQILSFVLAFAPMSYEDVWVRLGMFSLFIHIVSTAGFSILYFLQSFLSRFSLHKQAALIVFIFETITCLLSLTVIVLFPEQTSPAQWSFLLKNMAICLFVSLLFIHTMTIFLDKLQAAEVLAKVELDALSARIRPHFLYNSLNTVAELTQIDADAAEHAIITLARLCKATMHVQQLNALVAELQLAKQYLELERWRFAERLVVDWQVPEDIADIKIPVLTIQPLLENAIIHGVEGVSGISYITVKLTQNERFAVLEISNSYLASHVSSRQGQGVAQANIRARLSRYFGDRATLRTQIINGQYIARLELPRGELL
ncbi:alginate biosynthesis protein AlgZ/FimS [Pseudoalteromonas sp. A25]|uniref:sensor histidine kinase n=1 Tax=Pseudoalteromonas sp. A25 TaxID=116092 RepID=UPI001261132D|nr:histidine kinase [Pseudoalteromonas sp. A25]BBN80940.1 alginate biosynthesis protein AlgZ/FimS [Pseudoalteromonas sp. A25]